MAETLTFENKAFEDKFDVNVLRHAVTSPDGKSLIFNAVGYLWRHTFGDGETKRLTNDKDFESEPAFAPDGNSIVYVTWNDENRGAIHTLDLRLGNHRKITTKKGIYRTPSYSPDGKTIVFRKEGAEIFLGTYDEFLEKIGFDEEVSQLPERKKLCNFSQLKRFLILNFSWYKSLRVNFKFDVID